MTDSITPRRKFSHTSTCPEYRIWRHMINRCENKNNRDYYRYGGRGITICQKWRKSFAEFLHDAGPRPSPDHSINWIDNNGNYEPGNVNWATRKEQARNTRVNRLITYGGVTMSATEWAEVTGLRISTIRGRLNMGWSVVDIFECKPRGYSPIPT